MAFHQGANAPVVARALGNALKEKGGNLEGSPRRFVVYGEQSTNPRAAALYREAACLAITALSFGSTTPRFLTTLKMPLLAWAIYIFNRA